jgi:hypothetical protein
LPEALTVTDDEVENGVVAAPKYHAYVYGAPVPVVGAESVTDPPVQKVVGPDGVMVFGTEFTFTVIAFEVCEHWLLLVTTTV